jgi:hypothetical protein
MITEEYKAALKSNIRHPIYKIEWMDKFENVIGEVTTDVLEGSVSIDGRNGTRRSCSLSLNNKNGTYIPDKDGLIYVDKKFKLYSGLLINNVEVFPPECIQGVFNLGNPVIRSDITTETIAIEGYDNFALLNGTISGQLDALYITNIGETIQNVVRKIFSEAGIIKSPLVYLDIHTIPYTISKEPGSTYEEMLTDLANILGWDVYCDVNGRPIFKPPVDQLQVYHSWVFDKDTDPFVNYEHNYDYLNVRNYVVVYGDNINGDQAMGTASDTSIFSPTSISRIGKRTKVISDTMIDTDSLAHDRAVYELKNSLSAYEYIDLDCQNIDFLKEGDVVLLNDTANKIYNERYIIKQINRNLKFDQPMTVTAYKVREVSTIGL